MPPVEWHKVEEIFEEALDVPPEERGVWIERRCGADAELRGEVQSLLAAEAASANFLPRANLAKAVLSLLTDEVREDRRVGPYKILREVGRGGMGVVLLAEREDEEFRQQVAIKLIKRGMDTDFILRRFRNERQILASLNHPSIAKLFDGGTTEDGQPYFVMEYIEGVPLLQYCGQQELSTTERLRLFRDVCAAVQHAHQNLVIHRDIKPSNILVTREGEVKLLDFGVAKFLNPESSGEEAAATQTALRLMTPEYASPEQVRGEHLTTATDIYSLGVVLYELLTGTRPFKLKDASSEELSRAIRETEPSKPSDAISGSGLRVANSKHHSSVQSTIPNPKSLRGDIDNIVLMALRKEAERRYKSVEQFSEDIRRHLEGLPITAHKDTFAYRASKFVRRHKAIAAAAALVLLTIIAGLIVTLWQARIAREQRDAARAAQAKAERISQFLSAALSYSDPSAAVADAKNRRDATISQMLDEVAPRIEAELADQPEARASLQRTVGTAYSSQLRFAEAESYLRAALQTQLQIYGEGHQEIALTLAGLAFVQEMRGNYAEAEASLRKAIAIYHNQPPKDQTHLKAFATTLYQFGQFHWTKGDFQTAESAFTESMPVASQLHGGDRESLADAKFGLGITRYAQGRLDEATTLLRDSLDEYRRLPHTRWKWSHALNFLAQVLTWKNEFDEALKYLQESETISLEIWGENNQWYSRSLWLRVYALCFKGDCAAAEEPLRRSEEIYNRILPDNKVYKANIYDARNIILTRTGRAREGEAFGRQAIGLYQSTMNRGAPSITLARINLAESLEAQKKHDEAERVLLEAFKDASEVQGVQHWRTKTAARALVKLYETWSKPDRAAEYRSKS